MIIWNTFFNWNFNSFGFFKNFLSIALFAFTSLSDDFTLSFTFITMFLYLLIHSWTHLIHLNNHTFSFTLFTFLNILSTFTFTFLTASSSGIFKFHNFTIVNILQRDWEGFFSRFNFGDLFTSSCSPSTSSTSSSSTEEHIHNIIMSLWSLSSLSAILIIISSLLWITECLICLIELLEFFNISIFSIRMKFFSKLFIFLFNFLG